MPAQTKLVALTREVSRNIQSCELVFEKRAPIDVDVAAAEHAQYEACLSSLGCRVERVSATPDLPDGVFVEDTAVVLDEVAIITRPGAASRRSETVSVANNLARYRETQSICEPGTLDGGDVLVIGRTIYVGASTRTNENGIEQLRRCVMPFGYDVEVTAVRGCLHLKSAVTLVAPGTVVLNPAWTDASVFADLRQINVHDSEPNAANALLVGETVLYATHFPATRDRLADAGIRIVSVPAAELAKAEGGVTCCCLLFRNLP